MSFYRRRYEQITIRYPTFNYARKGRQGKDCRVSRSVRLCVRETERDWEWERYDETQRTGLARSPGVFFCRTHARTAQTRPQMRNGTREYHALCTCSPRHAGSSECENERRTAPDTKPCCKYYTASSKCVKHNYNITYFTRLVTKYRYNASTRVMYTHIKKKKYKSNATNRLILFIAFYVNVENIIICR